MSSKLQSLLNDTFYPQEITRDKIKSAYETYRNGYKKAVDEFRGQKLQDETVRLWNNFQNARDNALNVFDVEHERAFDSLKKYLTDQYTKAPNEAVNNTLTAFSLRSSLSKGDVDAAVITLNGSLMGLSTLYDIVHRIAPDCIVHVPAVPNYSKVMQLAEDQKSARSESMHNYYQIAPGDTEADGALNNYVFDPESGLKSFFDAMQIIEGVLSGGEK